MKLVNIKTPSLLKDIFPKIRLLNNIKSETCFALCKNRSDSSLSHGKENFPM